MAKAKPSAKGPAGWRAAARPLVLYGALLAAGTFALSWLDYFRISHAFPGEILIFLVAAGFLGFGVWVGASLFAGRSEAAPFDGNPNAQAALGLSAREMEVLALLADGLANKEIAARLGVSPNTVKTHVARVLEKLEVRRRTAALARARELGLLP